MARRLEYNPAMSAKADIKLLPKNDLIRTSSVDHADWNYNPVLAVVMRQRFALIKSLLPATRVRRILEIGFGSGIFMPELAQWCDELYGIDVHPYVVQVRDTLQRQGVLANLTGQDAAQMKFADEFFNVMVCVSALEFIPNLDEAARRAARALAPSGILVAVMPAQSLFLDFMLLVLTGERAKADYGDRREQVLPTMLKHFEIAETAAFPPVYRAYAFKRRTTAA